MVTWVAGLTLWAAVAGTDSLRPVLARERFPWYDAGAGRVVPVLPWFDFEGSWLKTVGDWLRGRFGWLGEWFRWLNGFRIPWIGGAGDLIAVGLILLLLTVVLVGLLELLRRYRPVAGLDEAAAAVARGGAARRIEGLPAGVAVDLSDPWAEAGRRRARGDYAGAVLYLFAYQLLTLDRLKQTRLVPGRTGRQLVRAVADRQLRGWVEPTLRLFEAVYYGHRAPSPEAFEAAWALAEAFRQRVTAEAAP